MFGKKFARGKKGGYAELMLTSLVDMFTIIVIFLIQNFSASGDVMYMTKDIKLPYAGPRRAARAGAGHLDLE